jgi:hypothetical protein
LYFNYIYNLKKRIELFSWFINTTFRTAFKLVLFGFKPNFLKNTFLLLPMHYLILDVFLCPGGKLILFYLKDKVPKLVGGLIAVIKKMDL